MSVVLTMTLHRNVIEDELVFENIISKNDKAIKREMIETEIAGRDKWETVIVNEEKEEAVTQFGLENEADPLDLGKTCDNNDLKEGGFDNFTSVDGFKEFTVKQESLASASSVVNSVKSSEEPEKVFREPGPQDLAGPSQPQTAYHTSHESTSVCNFNELRIKREMIENENPESHSIKVAEFSRQNSATKSGLQDQRRCLEPRFDCYVVLNRINIAPGSVVLCKVPRKQGKNKTQKKLPDDNAIVILNGNKQNYIGKPSNKLGASNLRVERNRIHRNVIKQEHFNSISSMDNIANIPMKQEIRESDFTNDAAPDKRYQTELSWIQRSSSAQGYMKQEPGVGEHMGRVRESDVIPILKEEKVEIEDVLYDDEDDDEEMAYEEEHVTYNEFGAPNGPGPSVSRRKKKAGAHRTFYRPFECTKSSFAGNERIIHGMEGLWPFGDEAEEYLAGKSREQLPYICGECRRRYALEHCLSRHLRISHFGIPLACGYHECCNPVRSRVLAAD